MVAERLNCLILLALGGWALGFAVFSEGEAVAMAAVAVAVLPVIFVLARSGARENGYLLACSEVMAAGLLVSLTHGQAALLVPVILCALSWFGDYRVLSLATLVLVLEQAVPAWMLKPEEFTASLASALALGGAALWLQRMRAQQMVQMALTEASAKQADSRLEESQEQIRDLTSRLMVSEAHLENVVRQVQKAGIHVASATTTIAANAKEQEGAISQQVAATTQITASTREIAATSQELLKTVTQVALSASETSQLAEGGKLGLARMQETMRQMVQAADQATARLSMLSEKATGVSGVVTTISKVAEQTNILSLNAAIESEKAGEYGRGFAVVSKEIRKLADQTAVATLDIGRLIRDMQSAVSSQVMSMEKYHDDVRSGEQIMQELAGQLARIIEQVQTISQRIDDVNLAMSAQAEGAEQISQTLRQVSQSSQDSARAVKEATKVVDQLKTATHRLQATLEACAQGG